MRFRSLCVIAILASLSVAGSTQAKPAQTSTAGGGATPAMEAGLGYSYFHANAPPSNCGCFSLDGGYGTFIYHFSSTWSVVADLAAAHANNVAGTTQSITTFDYLFGPRYTLRPAKKVMPYGQVLFGGVTEFSNYAAVHNLNTFGLSAGGGINTSLNRRIAWNIVEADWVYTRLPNGVNTHQNLFRVSTGLTLRFGSR
jgi:outer membrane immunogenic protein